MGQAVDCLADLYAHWWNHPRFGQEIGQHWTEMEKAMTSAILRQNTYDRYADRYAQSYSQPGEVRFNFNRDFIIPRLLHVVGDVTGLRVLDAGCGEGIVSRVLAHQAAEVVGFDVSPRLIELARERAGNQRLAYEVHDLSQALPQYAHSFDVVVSNMVLNDAPDYKGFIATLSAVTKPQGRIVLSLNNPYSAVLREKVDSYFDSGKAVLYNMARDGIAVYYYHHTMQEYMTAFQKTGLLLRSLVDLQLSDEMAAQLPDQNREFSWFPMYHRFPFVVVLELVKPAIDRISA
jgi:2-polyprenyl-3-methyl-5-hydroxy-6-metoxy-1,4-benzoquinol methylase